jgi:hypothetical protein
MNFEQQPPIHRGPPQPRATVGDTLFALGIAALGLVLAGGLLAAGGGLPGLGLFVPAAGAAPGPGSEIGTPGPAAPSEAPSGASSSAASATGPPLPSSSPTATPAGPFTMNLYRAGVFVHEVDKKSCVAAAVQQMLNVIRLGEDGRRPDVSHATQRTLHDRIAKLTTWEDSHNGGTGPGGWAAVLTEEGYRYEVRTYPSRLAAMRAAASALRATGRPVGILAWAGVHSWVMTGFTATADPATTTKLTVTTAFILDPWYPWVSTRWPRSEAPNAPRDIKDLIANVLPWKLASGPYPGRDGKFVLVVPIDG